MAIFPVFGKNPSGKRLKRVEDSSNYSRDAFNNPEPTELLLKGSSYFKMMREYWNKPKNTTPPVVIPSVRTDLRALPADKPVIVWFGHSSYLLKVKGIHILVDPVFSGHASPVSFFGKSFPGTDVYGVDDLPEIDIVLLTHDHYDHLDHETILQLSGSGKARYFFTSLGVGSHLEYWGISPERIVELDWWESGRYSPAKGPIRNGGVAGDEVAPGIGFAGEGEISLTATPGRHFSGRSLHRNQTLWSSFVVKIAEHSFFLGGDSGYGKHFKKIGEQYGPFELAVLESGQYGKNWPDIHMMPEQTVTATQELHARLLLPVHWCKFMLSVHAWDEPIRRLVKSAEEKKVRVTTPQIGEPVILDSIIPQKKWWESISS